MPTYQRTDGDDVVERITTETGSLEDTRLAHASTEEGSAWSAVGDDAPAGTDEPGEQAAESAPQGSTQGRAPRNPRRSSEKATGGEKPADESTGDAGSSGEG